MSSNPAGPAAVDDGMPIRAWIPEQDPVLPASSGAHVLERFGAGTQPEPHLVAGAVAEHCLGWRQQVRGSAALFQRGLRAFLSPASLSAWSRGSAGRCWSSSGASGQRRL